MAITVLDTRATIHNLHTRMPFHYGIAALTAVPHLILQVSCEVDGTRQTGLAADSLIPKWFTKDPESLYQDDLADMLAVIQAACGFAKEVRPVTSVFALWQALYVRQKSWAEGRGYPPLLWGFGLSLVERAILSAFCCAKRTTLAEAVRSNSLGVRLDEIHPELAGKSPGDLLPEKPLRKIMVRHTVGLADPLTDEEIPPEWEVSDGLPVSLSANIQRYGLRRFKLKLCGDDQTDIQRLKQIAAILEKEAPRNYAFTLDGNEQYMNVSAFQRLWRKLTGLAGLSDFLSKMLYVEQPLHRDAALCPTTQEPLRRWVDRPPMIIDESDAELDSLKVALDCGYYGTSHKNCKGVFKGLANACLISHLKEVDPEAPYTLSGEDLANIGPVALPQDLAVMATLGIDHVERNGHHYFSGLSMYSPALQREMLNRHSDLYREQARFATLDIRNGIIQTGSIIEAPFGLAPEMQFDFESSSSGFIPIDDWQFESLKISV